jgi:hypothetical protein
MTATACHARKGARLGLAVLLSCHAALLAWSSAQQSPTPLEAAAIAAGLCQWRSGRHDSYRVNPPLVRLLAAIPAALHNAADDWRAHDGNTLSRTEFRVGEDFVSANAGAPFTYIREARWACMPLSVLGAWISWRWARDLYGDASGLVAATLWCFYPSILGHGALVSADVAASALGVGAGYYFWRWLRKPSLSHAAAATIFLGLAESCKLTWIVLFALWPVLWIVWRLAEIRVLLRRDWLVQAVQLLIVVMGAAWIVNVFYGFDGSFKRLGDYRFTSEMLSGRKAGSFDRPTGNRFAHCWLADLPVPLPADYIYGIDQQKRDFEAPRWAYLAGKWRFGGWRHYYLYALAVKVPLGTWLLAALGAYLALFRPGYRGHCRDEAVVLLPALTVLAVASSQTAINEHFRYVLPAVAFALISISKVGRCFRLAHSRLAAVAIAALVWSVGSSLYAYPHNLSYFNELVGGPRGGPLALLGSNVDWGQDLFYLRRWRDNHLGDGDFYVSLGGGCNQRLARIDYTPVRLRTSSSGTQSLAPLRSGWCAVSVNSLYAHDSSFKFLRLQRPAGLAGYSIYLYRIEAQDALQLSDLLADEDGGGSQ